MANKSIEIFHKASRCLWKPSGGSWGGSGGSPFAHQHLTEVQGGWGRALLRGARTGGPGHGLGGAGGPRGKLWGRLHLGPRPAQGVPAVILHCLLYYHNSPDQGQPITFMAALWPANGTHGEEIPGSESSWQRLYKFPKLHRNFWYTEHTLLWDLAKAQENFKTVLGREREKLRGFEERQKPSWNVQGESLFQLTELNAGSEEAIFQ